MVQQDSRQGANGQLMSQLKLTREWRAIVKDPIKFIAKCVAQGIEVSWQKLNKVQRQTMKETNQAMKELPSARLIRHGSCGCAGSLFCKQLALDKLNQKPASSFGIFQIQSYNIFDHFPLQATPKPKLLPGQRASCSDHASCIRLDSGLRKFYIFTLTTRSCKSWALNVV